MLKKPNRAIAFVLAAALGVITVSQAGDTGRLTSNSAGVQTATPSAPPIKTGACSGNTVQDYNVNVGDRTSNIASSCVTPVTQLPNQCADQGVSWGVGNVCAATAPTVSSGSTTRVVNATANYTGQADFLCQNGTYQVTGSPTCNYVPQSCSTQAVTWGANGCSGSSGSVLAHGSTRTINNTAANRSGSTMIGCSNGTITTTTPSSCNLTNQACTAANVSWGSGCSGDIAGFPHNSSLTINNTAPGKVGSATFSCNNGSKQYQSGSCNNPAPTTCSSQSVTWGGGCKATVPTMQDGTTRNVTNSDYGFIESSGGPSTAACSGGVVTVAANTTCTARPDGSYCPPRTLNWGGVCTAQTPFMLKDNADTWGFPPLLENENPNASGSTYALCKTGIAQPDLANSTCTAFDSTFRLNLQVTPDPVPANSPISIQWSTVGAMSCALYVTEDGSVTYSYTSAPASGNVSAPIAEPGVAKVALNCKKASDPSGPYSSVVKNLTIIASGTKCQSQTVTWGIGCGTTVSSMTNGQSQTVNNFQPGYTGSAALTCNAGNLQVSSSTCQALKNCSATTGVWGSGGACTAPLAASNHGQSLSVNSTATAASGNAQFVCDNGTFKESSGATCTPKIPCAAQNVTWQTTVGWGTPDPSAPTCTASVPALQDGKSYGVESSNANDGTASLFCSGGVIYNVSATCVTSNACIQAYNSGISTYGSLYRFPQVSCSHYNMDDTSDACWSPVGITSDDPDGPPRNDTRRSFPKRGVGIVRHLQQPYWDPGEDHTPGSAAYSTSLLHLQSASVAGICRGSGFHMIEGTEVSNFPADTAAGCPRQAVAWGDGCVAKSTAHVNSNQTVVISTPTDAPTGFPGSYLLWRQGTATFQCNPTTKRLQVQPGATCAPKPQ